MQCICLYHSHVAALSSELSLSFFLSQSLNSYNFHLLDRKTLHSNYQSFRGFSFILIHALIKQFYRRNPTTQATPHQLKQMTRKITCRRCLFRVSVNIQSLSSQVGCGFHSAYDKHIQNHKPSHKKNISKIESNSQKN